MDETDKDAKATTGEPEVTLDRLSGEWWIYQLRRGQRYATDDVLTAWVALRARPSALRLLDLGSGVGSIGLLTLRLLPPAARLVSVEVLGESVALARQTLALNRAEDRVLLLEGDLRDPRVLEGQEPFDLITANPPFLPPEAGWHSRHPQRAAARFELHGDVFDYCRVAARFLAPAGRLALCHAAADPRPERAAAEAGLRVLERLPVSFLEGRAPHLALRLCGLEAEGGQSRELPPLVVREASGRRSPGYAQVLRDLGMVE